MHSIVVHPNNQSGFSYMIAVLKPFKSFHFSVIISFYSFSHLTLWLDYMSRKK